MANFRIGIIDGNLSISAAGCVERIAENMTPSVSALSTPVSWRLIFVWAALTGTVMFVLGVSHQDFPYDYHPDEPSKIAQLISGRRDYHHPPLMLSLTDGLTRFVYPTPQPEDFARVGRTISAGALAGAVALLTILAGFYGGTTCAALTAALALATDGQAVLAAHFLKEDALFAFALTLTFVAGAVHWRRQGGISAFALGAAAGLALSAKYVGALAVLQALALAALSNNRQVRDANRAVANTGTARTTDHKSLAPLGWCTLGIAVVATLCIGPALWSHWQGVVAGLRQGASTVQEGNRGVGARVPHLQFVGMFFLTPVPVLLGAAVFWVDLRRYPFLIHADRWLTGLSPLWLVTIFSFSASTAVRYFLPVSLMLGCIGGATLPEALRWAVGRIGPRAAYFSVPATATLLAAALLLAFSLPGTISLLAGFAGDDRAALTRYIVNHLPPDAVIAEDNLAHLPCSALPGRTLLSSPAVADLGDVSALRARGVRYVVVCWYDSRRYVDPHKRPGPDAHDFLRRREFYATLPARARSLWKSELKQPFPLRPGLELFALQP